MNVDKWTDKQLEQLESRIKTEYRQAGNDLKERYDNYINGWDEEKDGKTIHHKSLQERYDEQYKAFEKGAYKDPTGRYTDEEMFNRWLVAQEGRGDHIANLIDQMDERLLNAGTIARDYTNGILPKVYTNNNNAVADLATASAMEQGIVGVRFDLVDEYAVKRLMEGSNKIKPYKAIVLDLPKMSKYNKTKLQNCILEGILTGASIDRISKKLEGVVGMNRAAAVRNARTAVTGAQAGGKQDRYEDLADKGCITTKIWIATADERTREEHAEADGQEVDYNEPFEVGGEELMFPADTSLGASDWNIYNCRCSTKVGSFKFSSVLSDTAKQIDSINILGGNEEQSYNELLQNRDEINSKLAELKAEKDKAELEAITTFEEKAWETALQKSEEIKTLEEQLSDIKQQIREVQAEKAKEVSASLIDKGYCEKAFLTGTLSVDGLENIERALDNIIGEQGLPPVKNIIFNPKECGLRGCVAYYDNITDSIVVSSKFAMTNAEYADYKKAVNDKYREYRQQKEIEKLSLKFIAEAQKEYSEATDKAHKFFAKQKEQNAIVNLNITRKSIPQTLEDVITHEYGHSLHLKVSEETATRKAKFFGADIMIAKGDTWKDTDLSGKILASKLSAYATENPLECFAEAFTAYQKGEEMPEELKGMIERAIKKVK